MTENEERDLREHLETLIKENQRLTEKLGMWTKIVRKRFRPFQSVAMVDLGPCEGCSDPIMAGEDINFYEDGDVHLVTHEGCWDEG